MKRYRLLFLVFCAMLSACSVLPQSEPLRIYRLPSQLAPTTATAPVEWSLRVGTPLTSRVLDSARIAVMPEGDRISSYQGARWSDSAPALIRDRLIEAFHDDGRVQRLSSDENRLHADLELVSDLRAFQSEYRDGTPHVVIRLDARLVRSANQRIVASRRFEVSEPSQGVAVEEVVRAFGRAADTLGRQIVDWTLAQEGAAVAPVR